MFDGSSIAGWKAINESDMLLMPDPTTAVMDPFFSAPTMVINCDVLEPATGEPVDPVGPRAKGHVTGRCGQTNAALDLSMACLDAGAAANLGLDEPCRDGLEGGPPKMADGRVVPVRVKHGARQRPQFSKRIVHPEIHSVKNYKSVWICRLINNRILNCRM